MTPLRWTRKNEGEASRLPEAAGKWVNVEAPLSLKSDSQGRAP